MTGLAVFDAGLSHCFPVVLYGGYWVALHGRDGMVMPKVVGAAGHDMVAYYRDEHGLPVVEVDLVARPMRAPLIVATCVGLTKRTLGLRCRAVTPGGLYRHLRRKT